MKLNNLAKVLATFPTIALSSKRKIITHITKLQLAQLITDADYILKTAEIELYNGYINRLLNGEPLAYILQQQEFYSLPFNIDHNTLIPRPETELLVDLALAVAPSGAKILDLGTGCGCIAISLKKNRPDLQVTASDISVAALQIARKNALLLQTEIDFYQSDCYAHLAASATFDLIISNPPYIAADDRHLSELMYEPLSALTDFADGLQILHKVISRSSYHLKANGWIMLEHGYQQAMAVQQFCQQAGLMNIKTQKDYAGHERLTYARYLVHNTILSA